MPKKNNIKNMEDYNTNNSFNIDIEELKGTRVTLNGDNSKYLIIYEQDVNFIEAIQDLRDYVSDMSKKYSEEEIENIEGLTEDEESEAIAKQLNSLRDFSEEIAKRFNKIFNDDEAYSRIFGTVLDITLVIHVLGRILDYTYNVRKSNVNRTSKYTDRYKN